MKFLAIRTYNTLKAVDDRGRDVLSKIKPGKIVTVEVKQPRNIKELRFYFAMIDLLFQQQTWFTTPDDLDEEIRVAIGHCTTRKRPNGEILVRPKSLQFGKLDQYNWRTFLDAAIKLACEKIVPGLPESTLKSEVEEMIYAPSPR